MKRTTRLISAFLASLMLMTLFSGVSFAATCYYETINADTPIHSEPYGSSKTVRTIPRAGTVLTATGSTTNKYGNVWYRLSDGNYVWSSNVRTHTHTAAACSETKSRSYQQKDASSHWVFSYYDEVCSCGAVVQANASMKTSESHSYTGGICSSCGYEWSYTVTSLTAASYTVTNKDGCAVWSRPYSYNSTKKSVAAYGSTLTVVAKTTNQAGNLWYKLSGGSWIYSGNVSKSGSSSSSSQSSSHTHKAAACGPTKSESYQSIDESYHYAVAVYDELCSCGAVVRANASSKTKQEHTYSGGICTSCNHVWSYSITSVTPTDYTVTAANGAPLYNRPYSVNSTKLETRSAGSVVTVTAKTTNQSGNLWYRVSNGYWVWSGNVSKGSSSQTVAPAPAGETYTVTYNANGGQGAPASETQPTSQAVRISSVKPTRSGYTFAGWATAPAGSAAYKPGDVYLVPKSVTLYAVWTKDGCAHRYSSEGGDACLVCGELYIPVYTELGVTLYALHADVPVRSAPYAGCGYEVRTLAMNEGVSVAASFCNSLGHLWYKTADGFYVYSENLGTTSFHLHAAVSRRPASTKYEPLDANRHKVIITTAAELCSCGTVVSGGKTAEREEAHTFRDGVCTLCGTPAEMEEVSITPALYATSAYSVPVCPAPSQTWAGSIRELPQGTLVTIQAQRTVFGYVWGRTMNDTWIPISGGGQTFMTPSNISLPSVGLYSVTASSLNTYVSPAKSPDIVKKLSKSDRLRITAVICNDAGEQWGKAQDGSFAPLSGLSYSAGQPQVMLNGKALNTSSPVLNRSGRLLVPIRDISEALGAQVSWNESTRTAVIRQGLRTVVLQIGKDRIYSEDIRSLDVEAQIVNGRTYVPLRALSEMFGAEVSWSSDTQTASITCTIPGEDAAAEYFERLQFYNFNYYSTFAEENNTLGQALLYTIGRVGSFGKKIITGMGNNVTKSLAHNDPLEANPLSDYSERQYRESLDALLRAIPEIEQDEYVEAAVDASLGKMNSFTGYLKTGEKTRDVAVELINNSKSEAGIERAVKKLTNKNLKSFIKTLGKTIDYASFSADQLAYLLQEYDRHLYYLDVVEEACKASDTPGLKDAIDELRDEYEDKVTGLITHTCEQIQEEFSGTVLSSVPLYSFLTAGISTAFTLTGVNSTTGGIMDAAAVYPMMSALIHRFSELNSTYTKDGKLRSSVTDAQMREFHASFVVAKSAVLRCYEGMLAAEKTPAVRVYLQDQISLIERISMASSVSAAKNGLYSLD